MMIAATSSPAHDWRELYRRFVDFTQNGEYPPHAFCLTFDDQLITLTVIASFLIWLAYQIIAGLLLFVHYRLLPREVRTFSITASTWSFVVFISSCGWSHLLKLINVFAGAYWIEGYFDMFVATVSMTTACMMVILVSGQLRVILGGIRYGQHLMDGRP